MTFAASITRIRKILNSYSAVNWTDAEILEYLNDGYTDFAVRTEYFRKETDVTLTASSATQSLPTDAINIFRGEWDGEEVYQYTTDQMDEAYGSGWRTATANNSGDDVQAIMQDMEDNGKFRIYPILGSTAIGSTKLKLTHSYLPAEITSTASSASIPAIYHEALCDYAISKCLETNVQSDQRIQLADRYYNRYMDAVTRCRRDMAKSRLTKSSTRLRIRNFV